MKQSTLDGKWVRKYCLHGESGALVWTMKNEGIKKVTEMTDDELLAALFEGETQEIIDAYRNWPGNDRNLTDIRDAGEKNVKKI